MIRPRRVVQQVKVDIPRMRAYIDGNRAVFICFFVMTQKNASIPRSVLGIKNVKFEENGITEQRAEGNDFEVPKDASALQGHRGTCQGVQQDVTKRKQCSTGASKDAAALGTCFQS